MEINRKRYKFDQIIFSGYPLLQQPYQYNLWQLIFYLPIRNLIPTILAIFPQENKLNINIASLTHEKYVFQADVQFT